MAKQNSIGDILASSNNSQLARLTQKTKQLAVLNQLIRSSLPSYITQELAQQITVHEYYQGILKLSVPNASLATQLRNSAQTILKNIHTSKNIPQKIISLQFRIKPIDNNQSVSVTSKRSNHTQQNSSRYSRKINPASRDRIKQLANKIADNDLSAALKKLAKKDK